VTHIFKYIKKLVSNVEIYVIGCLRWNIEHDVWHTGTFVYILDRVIKVSWGCAEACSNFQDKANTLLKDRNCKPERGEWMWADKNYTQEFGLWTQFHSDTSASFSCQVHVAIGVLLDLGERSNQQPLETRNGKQLETAAGNQNRSSWFLKPVTLTFWDLASHRLGKPVRPVWQTGQAGFV
jgi:hypothetical protein